MWQNDAIYLPIMRVSLPFFCDDASSGTIARDACRRAQQIFIFGYMQSRSWYLARKWFPRFTNFYCSIWLSCSLVMELLSFMCPTLSHRSGQAVACSYIVQSHCLLRLASCSPVVKLLRYIIGPTHVVHVVHTFRCSDAAREDRPLWRPSTRYDFEGGQSLKALDSVKHEGPTTRKLQIGVICRALNTEAFTSFYQAYDGTKCYCPPWHHCLFTPHGVENCTVLTLFPLRMAALSRPPSRSFPSSRLGTAPFSLLPSDATGISSLRWRLALAQ